MTFPRDFKIDRRTKTVTFLNKVLPSPKRCSGEVLRKENPINHLQSAAVIVASHQEADMNAKELYARRELQWTLKRHARRLLDNPPVVYLLISTPEN